MMNVVAPFLKDAKLIASHPGLDGAETYFAKMLILGNKILENKVFVASSLRCAAVSFAPDKKVPRHSS
jgi:hypothetical protein